MIKLVNTTIIEIRLGFPITADSTETELKVLLFTRLLIRKLAMFEDKDAVMGSSVECVHQGVYGTYTCIVSS